MICVNELKNLIAEIKIFYLQLNALPHHIRNSFLTEFIWQNSGWKNSIHHEEYPKHDEAICNPDVVTYPGRV